MPFWVAEPVAGSGSSGGVHVDRKPCCRRQRLGFREEVLDPIGVSVEDLLLQRRHALLPQAVSERFHVSLEPLNEIIGFVLRPQRRCYTDVEALESTFRGIDDRFNFNRFPQAVDTMGEVSVPPSHNVLVAFLGIGTLCRNQIRQTPPPSTGACGTSIRDHRRLPQSSPDEQMGGVARNPSPRMKRHVDMQEVRPERRVVGQCVHSMTCDGSCEFGRPYGQTKPVASFDGSRDTRMPRASWNFDRGPSAVRG